MSDAGMEGHLRLVCATRPDGTTYLREQAFSAPMHLSKPYWDGATLLVHVVNQTAGIFGGDRIRSHVVVEDSACVLLSSPSAARFHPSRGRESRLDQTFTVGAGGRLDICPEISIPHRGSRSEQVTRIDLAPSAELVYLETLTPGRVASGEMFAFERFAWRTDIFVAGRRVLRERACVTPGTSAGLRALHAASYHASLVIIQPAAQNWGQTFPRSISALTEGTTALAASRLSASGWSVRILAGEAVSFQRAIRQARATIYEHLGRTQPDLRRNGL